MNPKDLNKIKRSDKKLDKRHKMVVNYAGRALAQILKNIREKKNRKS